MFRAKLIENEDYYKLRRKQLFLTLIPVIPFGLVINFYKLPTWVSIMMIGIYIIAILLMFKNQKKMNLIIGKKILEIEEEEIRIKTKNGEEKESFNLNKIEKLILKREYSIPQETISEVGKEIIGDTKQNYIIIKEKEKENRKLEFDVDSYYMIKQLNKIIQSWEKKGFIIEIL